MSLSSKKCCVPGCMDSDSMQMPLHLFPNPSKDIQRFKTWVRSIGGDIIGLESDDIYKHRRVCHAHFEAKFCCRFNRLSNIAAPTLNLPGPLSLPKFTFAERRPLKQKQYSPEPLPSTSKELAMDFLASTSTDLGMKENIDPFFVIPEVSKIATETVFEVNVAGNPIHGRCTKKPTKTVVSKKVKAVTELEHDLYQKLSQVRNKLSKYRSKVKKQIASVKAAKKLGTNPAFIKAIDKFPSTAKILTLLQFREIKKKDKGRRFSLEEKIVALSILKQSPKCYRFLRKIFILPTPQTLTKLINRANVKPGINKSIFSQIKKKSEKLKDAERLCIVLFDGMSLKANVTYNERKDCVIGFVTDGQKTRPEYVNHAQVFMIRGLMKNYKQPVSYSFSAGPTSGPELAKQLKEVIKELQEAGLIVVATVSDQGTNNRHAIKLLIQETRGIVLKSGQEPKGNIFSVNDQEIVPLYDPPHLIKCTRNNLITKNLTYKAGDQRVRTAKWQHIEMLLKENPGYKGIRLIPKLTDNHVVPHKIFKMKVKYATQIFSQTVASNMGYLADKGILPAECKETADILLFFDELFDSLNGSYAKKEKRGKPLLGPARPNSVHNDVWNKAKIQLKNMKYINKVTGKPEKVPTLENWVWTLDGIQIILKKLQNVYGITSVWMRHFNQDPVENFFGAIRSHGCRNTNPTTERFESAYISLLINNISSVHAPGANCEKDFCKVLHNLIITDDCPATETSELEAMPNVQISDISEKNDPRVMGALQFVSGYFVHSARKKVFKNCPLCTKDMIASNENEYIRYREYAGRRWLVSPSVSPLLHIFNAGYHKLYFKKAFTL